jgi:hypothetical protein
VGALSVLSNVRVTPEQLAWLMDQFGAQWSDMGDGWTIEFGGGLVDYVGVADGSDDIASIPPQITEDAAKWLGGPPVFRLSILVAGGPQCQQVAERIIFEFARWWPAVVSDHTANPVQPVGHWWGQQQ